ncbi:MAG: GGDEF domain-containing protein [Polyangiaceae bacterium]
MSHSIEPKSGNSIRPPGWAEMDTGNVSPHPSKAPSELFSNPRAQLLLLNGTNAGQVFTVEPEQIETVIGRGRTAQVCVEDIEASREHCKITILEVIKHAGASKRYVLADLESKNGTYVNGHVITTPTDLAPGDRIQLGPNLILRFSLVDETEETLARQLYETSTRDALTQSYNRRYFLERLTSELAFAQRHKSKLAVLLFDLDRFKSVNDTYGHMAGDEVLRSVSACVGRLVRTEDVFARYGGEEFVLLIRGISHDNVDLLADRVRRAVERNNVSVSGHDLVVTISVGVASVSELPDGATSDTLITLADERLYRAKQDGRNRVCSR